MKIYPDYKSIDQLWLEEIPGEWQTIKIKYAFEERSEKGYPDEPLLVASQNMGVVPKSLYGNRTVEAQKDLHLLKLVRIGDFVISLRSFQGGIEYAYYQGIISPAYTIMVSKGILTSGYFRYLAKSHSFIELLKSCVTGIRDGQNIDYSKLKNYRIPVPPCPEQDQIVRFLDWKVSSINKLININQKEIVALGELKQNIITNCITMGLNQNVEMKYSGNEWINYIPWHWTTVQLRRVYAVILGKMLSPTSINNQDSYEEYVCAKDVHFDGVDLSSLKKMWFSQMEKKQYEIQKGDLLIVEGGAGAGNAAIVYDLCGKSVYVQNSIHIVRSKSSRVINKFLCYWISSLVKRGYMKNVCSVATIPHYTKDKVLSTIMPLPPIEEQTDIVDYLDMKCEVLDNIIAKKHKQIQLLQELKARLTSDAVTGKIDVRGIEIPEFEYMEETYLIGKSDEQNCEDSTKEEK